MKDFDVDDVAIHDEMVRQGAIFRQPKRCSIRVRRVQNSTDLMASVVGYGNCKFIIDALLNHTKPPKFRGRTMYEREHLPLISRRRRRMMERERSSGYRRRNVYSHDYLYRQRVYYDINEFKLPDGSTRMVWTKVLPMLGKNFFYAERRPSTNPDIKLRKQRRRMLSYVWDPDVSQVLPLEVFRTKAKFKRLQKTSKVMELVAKHLAAFADTMEKSKYKFNLYNVNLSTFNLCT